MFHPLTIPVNRKALWILLDPGQTCADQTMNMCNSATRCESRRTKRPDWTTQHYNGEDQVCFQGCFIITAVTERRKPRDEPESKAAFSAIDRQERKQWMVRKTEEEEGRSSPPVAACQRVASPSPGPCALCSVLSNKTPGLMLENSLRAVNLSL